MNFQEYQKMIKGIGIGKHLPDALYLHKEALDDIPLTLFEFLHKSIAILELERVQWDLVKLSKKELKISLLCYPTFFTESYPALHKSYTLNLEKYSYRTTNYTKSENPPILHRKETFLVDTHPAVPEFKRITQEGEEAGLYENSRTIGFKKAWLELIAQEGLLLVDGRLVARTKTASQVDVVEDDQPINLAEQRIERHKTAIDRNSLSSPMQSLFRHGYLQGKYSLFDYGCGKGDDLNILADHKVTASGWDPVYCPDNKIVKSDIVNLGFVVNVIEDQKERQETLKKAFKLSQKLLVVSVMLGGEGTTSKFEKYGDGVVTSRKTFQKYYGQTEFREYLQNALQETAIAVGPGVFYVFSDKLVEQDFLVERQRLNRNWQKLSYTDHPERLKVKQRALYERHKDLFSEFWQQCLDYGRLPANNEFSKSEELRALCSSHQKGLALLSTIHGDEPFAKATQARRDDLLVHYALGLFGRRKPYKDMSERLKKDVKHFFGSITKAMNEATALLFSVGKPELINKYCEQAHKELGRGRLEPSQAFTIHRNDVELLPAPLRVYLGCATQLYGDIDTVDLVKIHIRSGKVSLMKYDDFEGEPIPLLLNRIKIKLREQSIDFFKYGVEFEPQPVYLKSKYIDKKFLGYKLQVSFDKRLLGFEWLDLSGYGPSLKEFMRRLQNIEKLDFKKINQFK